MQPRAAKEVFFSDDVISLTVKAEVNCQIDTYIVKDVASSDKLQSFYSFESGILTVTITGLKARRTYTVQVYAINDQSQERPLGKPVTFQISSQSNGKKRNVLI